MYEYNYMCISAECYDHLSVLTFSGPENSIEGRVNPALYAESEIVDGQMHVHIY